MIKLDREFWKGYLDCVGFTATKYVENEGEGDSDTLFGGSGEFTDNWDMSEELKGRLTFRELREMVSDCLGFLAYVKETSPEAYAELEADLERAGNMFHYARNGHGVTFLDGDYENGRTLQDAAKTFGTLELAGRETADGKLTYSIHN